LISNFLGQKEYRIQDYVDQVKLIYFASLEKYNNFSKIGITGQMACSLLIDSDNNPASPVFSWQDFRSESKSEKLGKSWYEELKLMIIEKEDGLRPGSPVCTLNSYLSDINYEHKRKLSYVSLLNFLAYIISDDTYFLKNIHVSEAHSTGVYSLKKAKWLAIDSPTSNLNFPTVTDEVDFIEIAKTNTKIYMPIGDQQSSLLGSNITKTDVIIHMATGGQVARISQNEIEEENGYRIQTRPWLFKNLTIKTLTHLPAGRAINTFSSEIDHRYNLENSITKLGSYKLDVKLAKNNIFASGQKGKLISDDWFDSHSYELTIRIFLSSLAKIYIDSLNKLKDRTLSTLVFSGGSITKLPNLMYLLERESGFNAKRVIEARDSSIDGLRKLLSM
jgi:sugar (pentulose or hexulose) kinase